MRTRTTILILGVLSLKVYSQASEKQCLFNKDDKVYSPELANDILRFTPSIDEINFADSLAEIHIKKSRKDYTWRKEISDYKSYYRQYVGYLNEKKEKIIFINSFCSPEEHRKKEIINYRGGGSCYFTSKINLHTKDVFDFHVNAPK
jgi:hypothetical protein